MKKSLCLLLAGGLFFAGCTTEEKFAYNEEYIFSNVEFYCQKDLTIADLATWIPMGATVNSIKELENLIKENLDTYSIIQNSESGQTRIYLKNELQSITFLENNQATVVYKGETHTVSATLQPEFENERFIVGNAREAKQFYFEDGYVYYSIEIDPKGFGIKYIFDKK